MTFEPRRWWDCPLDVERLAWSSVSAAREAAPQIADLRQLGTIVGTGRPELLEQHLSNGMAKRSAILDLNAVRSTLEEPLTDAEVVLLGYRPGSLARFGLESDDLLDRHPHLVVASLTAWGGHGPWSSRSGFDSIVQAASGIAVACGSPEQPGALPVQALDHSTGYLLATHVIELLADARASIARASLLSAARTLLNHPSPPAQSSHRDGHHHRDSRFTSRTTRHRFTTAHHERQVPRSTRRGSVRLTV